MLGEAEMARKTLSLVGLVLLLTACAWRPSDPGEFDTIAIRVAGFVETEGIT
jgi:hypothetical protein